LTARARISASVGRPTPRRPRPASGRPSMGAARSPGGREPEVGGFQPPRRRPCGHVVWMIVDQPGVGLHPNRPAWRGLVGNGLDRRLRGRLSNTAVAGAPTCRVNVPGSPDARQRAAFVASATRACPNAVPPSGGVPFQGQVMSDLPPGAHRVAVGRVADCRRLTSRNYSPTSTPSASPTDPPKRSTP
jgi:hypothetical protein